MFHRKGMIFGKKLNNIYTLGTGNWNFFPAPFLIHQGLSFHTVSFHIASFESVTAPKHRFCDFHRVSLGSASINQFQTSWIKFQTILLIMGCNLLKPTETWKKIQNNEKKRLIFLIFNKLYLPLISIMILNP